MKNNAKEIENLARLLAREEIEKKDKPKTEALQPLPAGKVVAGKISRAKDASGAKGSGDGLGVPQAFEELDASKREFYERKTFLLMPSGLNAAVYKPLKSIEMHYPPGALDLKVTFKYKEPPTPTIVVTP